MIISKLIWIMIKNDMILTFIVLNVKSLNHLSAGWWILYPLSFRQKYIELCDT